MKAWLLDEQTGIDRLRVAQIPDPKPQAGEVVLDVRFAALNPADRYLAERQYPVQPTLPHILGRDGLGTVAELGAEVKDLCVGQKRAILRSDVGGSRPGTFAERVAVPTEGLIEVPQGWSDAEAAGATLVYLTAYQALTMWGDTPRGSVVLVTGASGGVGVATVQLAAALEYKVIALSRDEQKRKRLLELGAAMTFDPGDPQWRQQAKATLGKVRVDLAVDNIGGKLLPEVIDTLGELGKVSVVGRLAGPVQNFNTATLFFRRLRIGGVAVGAYTNSEARAAWAHTLQLLARTGARPLIDCVFPFSDLLKAFARLAEGPMGKVLLEVRPG